MIRNLTEAVESFVQIALVNATPIAPSLDGITWTHPAHAIFQVTSDFHSPPASELDRGYWTELPGV